MKFLLFLFTILFLISCKKEDVKSPNGNTSPHFYTAKTLLSDYPSLMGGDVDTSGNLITFNLPLLNDNFSSVTFPAKLTKLSNFSNGLLYHNFGQDKFSGTGSYTKDSIPGLSGWVCTGIRTDMAITSKNELWLSCNLKNFVQKKTETGGIYSIQAMYGITSIASNSKGEIYFLVSPIFNGSGAMTSPPVIYRFYDQSNIEEYYRFPENKTYNYANLFGSQSAMYPSDILMNLTFDRNDNLYICLGLDDVIYKLNANKQLTTFNTTIPCPTSICFSSNNETFVVSGPSFTKNQETDYVLDRTAEIYKIAGGSQQVIYSLPHPPLNGALFKSPLDKYYIAGANYNVTINSFNQLYLEDPLTGSVLLVK